MSLYSTRSSITGGLQNEQIKNVNEITIPPHIAKEPRVFSEIKSITLHLCGFTFIYAEIKPNRRLARKVSSI